MKILITGATGFIGRHLTNFLLCEGMQIFCVVRDTTKPIIFREPSDLLQVIKGDLNEASTFARLPKSLDVVIHLAAQLGDWNINRTTMMKTNVEMTQRLLDWFSSSDCKQFIFMSTPGVQGFGHKLAAETEPYNPRDIYEMTKVLAEKMIQEHRFKLGQNWTIIRPDFVYGPEDRRRIKLYRRIKARQWIKIGKGTSVLRPTHVTDVCRAIFMCLENPRAYSQIFNVAGPELISCDAYIGTIAKVLDIKLLPLRLPTLLPKLGALALEGIAGKTNTKPVVTKSQVEFLTQDHGTDISKIRDLIGFTPAIDLENGMRETFTWAKKQNLL